MKKFQVFMKIFRVISKSVNNEINIMSRGRRHKLMLILLICTFVFFLITYKLQNCVEKSSVVFASSYSEKDASPYNRLMPLIFIGGIPRSGTTLMRAMLDAHPDIRCGQETRVVPRILQIRHHWMKSAKEKIRLSEAGISTEVMNSAVAAFILEVIVKHGEPAPRLCNKDPLTLKHGDYLIELFPNSKFIFMVRDGRATVHSIISRKVTITDFDLNDYGQCLRKWNDAISIMYQKCVQVGPQRCMIVYYEQLVLHPKLWMEQILKFLGIPWDNAVLHHDELINKPGGVVLSKVERSSDQVIKPINLEALTKWVGQFPDDVLKDAATIAPMLTRLGYDTDTNPPDYGKPDDFVQNNTNSIHINAKIWQVRAKSLLALSPEALVKLQEANMTGLITDDNKLDTMKPTSV